MTIDNASNPRLHPDKYLDDFFAVVRDAAHLVGDDPDNVHPEYLRALAELTCDSAGFPMDYVETVQELLYGLGASYM